MNIKLIALDLDGTLLDSKKRLSPANEAALRACIDRGIHIVPATGRLAGGIPEFVRNIPGVRYAITANGGRVVDMQEGIEISAALMPVKLALEILEFAKTTKSAYDPYVNGKGAMEARFLEHLEDYGLEPGIHDLVLKTRSPVPDSIEHVKQWNKPIEKINMFFGDLEERARVKKVLEQNPELAVSSSLYNNLEINAADATKGNGILKLASYLGIPAEQTMAFGDGSNDLSMIIKAGIGVAMDNGDEYLKKCADYITRSNDQDGVADAIKKLVLSA
ncbi:Cof-type HAD-IIB family hydrolase [Clostridium sp. MCC353]|uniref:Cof-type HAD-IIB family hydrolase n=1 Tax=Clostridium sp. MCC353 TaxID=2592646 RepID=UPI001C0313AF|nr:Cof-type HAD-IIB family hydrolase [Clostridium sp. MCC353]MBT9779264.1 Cof-type HAD-IIB family hydrolase [Clostridium sp. MCC353]